MAGETIVTVIGNLTEDAPLRFTQGGVGVSSFGVAQTPRTFDRQKNEWVDGETLFWRCNIWRDMAENAAESLPKGTRVIIQGRLIAKAWQDKEGSNRTSWEVEVDEIGPSLRFATASVDRSGGGKSSGSKGGGGFGNSNTGGGFGGGQQGAQNGGQDPWGGQPSGGGSWGTPAANEPPF